jgi:hypothetical protein
MQTDHIRTFYMARMCDMHIVAWLEHHLKEINN